MLVPLATVTLLLLLLLLLLAATATFSSSAHSDSQSPFYHHCLLACVYLLSWSRTKLGDLFGILRSSGLRLAVSMNHQGWPWVQGARVSGAGHARGAVSPVPGGRKGTYSILQRPK